jgi:hypothetical protein
MSVSAYERELRRAQRQQRHDEATRLDQELEALVFAHRGAFRPAERPVAAGPDPVDTRAIQREERKAALAGVPWYQRKARRGAKRHGAQQAAIRIAEAESTAAREAERRQAELDELWARLLANDPEIVMEILEEAFEDNESPAAAIDVSGEEATLLVRFPPLDGVVPETTATITPSGRPSVKRRTKTERNNLYLAALVAPALVTAKEAFAVALGVADTGVIVISDDESSGDRTVVRPLYAARFSRAGFAAANWSDTSLGIAAQFPALLNLRGRTNEVAPLDLRSEPELARVVSHVAGELGWKTAQ